MNIDRDFENNPITPVQAIILFKNEEFELVFASMETVQEAARITANDDIVARWDDLQEELRCMAQEFM